PSAGFQRDAFGNPTKVTYTWTDGAVSTAAIAWDPFGLMPIRSETIGTGLATPLITTTEREPHSLLPLTVSCPTAAAIHNTFDNFSRLTRVTLSLPGDPQRFVLVDITLNGFDGAPTGRSITYKTFHQFVPESSTNNPPPNSFTAYTAVLDEFTRRLHNIVD